MALLPNPVPPPNIRGLDIHIVVVLPSRVPWHVLPYCDDYLLTVKGESPHERPQNGHRAARVAEEAIDFLEAERA